MIRLENEIFFKEIQNIMIDLIEKNYRQYTIDDPSLVTDTIIRENPKNVKHLVDNTLDKVKCAKQLLDKYLMKTLVNLSGSVQIEMKEANIIGFDKFGLNENKNSGFHSFDLFLNILTKSHLILKPYKLYNCADFTLFFKTGQIGDNMDIFLDDLEDRYTLRKFEKYLKDLGNESEIYIGFVGFKLEYGIIKDNVVYTCGEFKTNTDFVRKIRIKPPFKEISTFLLDLNLKNLILLNKIKSDFDTVFDQIQKKFTIIDNYTIIISMNLKDFKNSEDLKESDFNNFLNSYALKKTWNTKVYKHINLTEEKVKFVIRIK